MIPPPEALRTKRLLLRRWRADDVESFAAMNADPEVRRFFSNLRTPEESAGDARWLDGRFEADGFGPWAIEAPGLAPFIGFVGCWRVLQPLPFQGSVEAAWRLAKRFWGMGYATEAARAALHDVFKRCGVDDVVAYTMVANLPSRRVMERLGMSEAPDEAFDHPNLPDGHPLRRHVVYRLRAEAFRRSLQLRGERDALEAPR